jgi:sodium transport system permease protein
VNAERQTPNLPVHIHAILIYLIVLVLLSLGGVWIVRLGAVQQHLVIEIGIALGSAFLSSVLCGFDLRDAFRIRVGRMDVLRVLALVLLAVSTNILLTELTYLQSLVFGFPQELQKALESHLNGVLSLGFPAAFGLIVLLPAVCEEMLFRGVILDGLTRSYGKWAGIIACGALFSLLHQTAFQLLPLALLGMVFGYAVISTHSIFAGILMHAVNNAMVLTVFASPALRRGRFSWLNGDRHAPWAALAAAGAVFVVCFWLIGKRSSMPVSHEAHEV